MDISILYRCFLLLPSLFFSLSAYVQINDPDPELWIVIYLIPAILSFTVFAKPHLKDDLLLKQLSQVVVAVYLIFAAYISKSYSFENNLWHWILHSEEGREFGGVAVSSIWIWFLFQFTETFTFKKIFFVSLIIFIPMCTWLYVYLNKSVRRLWPQHCQSVAYSTE